MSSRRKSSNLFSFAVIGLVLAVFVLLILWYVKAVTNQKKVDPITGCELTGSKNHSVILVDQTDLLDKSQLNALRSLTHKITNDLHEGDMLSLFELSDQDPYLSGPLFSRCLPRLVENASEINANLRLIREAFEAEFVAPLDSGIFQIESNREESASQTPIIEAMLELVNRDDYGPNVNRRLIIVSDMLQHSEILSLYKNTIDHTRAVKDWGPLLMRSPDLTNVEVQVLLLLRQENLGGQLQNDSLILFWEQYFQNTGAHLASVRKAN